MDVQRFMIELDKSASSSPNKNNLGLSIKSPDDGSVVDTSEFEPSSKLPAPFKTATDNGFMPTPGADIKKANNMNSNSNIRISNLDGDKDKSNPL